MIGSDSCQARYDDEVRMETLLIKSEKLKIEVEIKQQVNSDDSNTEYRECEGSDSHQEVDSHDQDLLMVLLCYHFIKLFTSFFIGPPSQSRWWTSVLKLDSLLQQILSIRKSQCHYI